MISKEAQTPQKKKKKKNWLINFLTKDSQKNVIIGYFKNILSPAHIMVGPTHYKTHPHVSGRNYTPEISNKFYYRKMKEMGEGPQVGEIHTQRAKW